jgi:uncharacterized protein
MLPMPHFLRFLRLSLLLLGMVIVGLGIGAAGSRADPPLPPLTGRVVDLAGLLDAGTAQRLTAQLAGYEAKTSTQIVVVTLPDMQGYPIEQWGLTLLRGWQIGQKGKNNGVVLVVAPKEHELRIETGYGAEGPLPDATADVIIRHVIVPRFKQGDYGGGIVSGVRAIEAALDGSFTADQPGNAPSLSASGVAVFGQQIPWMTLLIIGIWIAIVVINILRVNRAGPRVYGSSRRRGYWDGGWGGPGGFGGGGFGGGGFGGGSGGGFGGGGGSGGGGGASGKW